MLQAVAVPEPVTEVAVRLPRHAFSPRDVARAGDVWRACQEAAVEASSRAGWPPSRYRAAGTGFVVRSMVVVHERELAYGEELVARTWVSAFRRGIFSTRQVRLVAGGLPAVAATQEWVHVSADLTPRRAGPELVDAFPLGEVSDAPELPAAEPADGPADRFELECWQTWMDPLAHVNHPAYVDWCDEAIARRAAAAGLAPGDLVPVAERVVFRSAATAGDRIAVTTRLVGVAGGAPVLAHRLEKNEGQLCAEAVLVRRHAGGLDEALVRAFAER
jgi:acyl-CoA thioesterase FadM